MSAYQRLVAFRRAQGRPPRLERQTVRVRGIALAVFSSPFVAGAPPLLCINGGLLYDHRSLWPTLAPLAARRQLILYDQRGRGASDAPPDPAAATIEDDAADVGALRRALGIRQWDVLGHSFGGGIAMLGAAADRAGTRRLVLVDAIGPTHEWHAALRAAAVTRLTGTDREIVEQLDERALSDANPEMHAVYSMAMHPAWFADPALLALFPPVRAISPTGAAVAARMRSASYDWRSRLRALSLPSLVIHGEEDPLPISAATLLAESLPDSRLVILPASGHMPFWEVPEQFFAVVDAFLSASNPGSART